MHLELAAELVAIGVAKSRAVTDEISKKGEARLLRTILKPLESFLRTTTDNEEDPSGEAEWLGRALDQERRTQNIGKEHVAMLQTDLARLENKTNQDQQALDHKITKFEKRIEERVEKLNKDIEKSNEEVERRIEKSIREVEERIEKSNKEVELRITKRIEKSNKKLMEAIQQLMTKP